MANDSGKPLTGNGALVATGKVTLKGGANMKADSLAAIVAGGDLTIAGTSKETSKFVGLLYTEGNLALANTQVVGSFIAAGDGDAGEGSMMSIVDSNVFTSPEGEDVEIVIQDFENEEILGRGGSLENILQPLAADLIINGEVRVDQTFIKSLLKIRYGRRTYDNPDALPSDISSKDRETLLLSYQTALAVWMERAKKLASQNAKELVEIVRFDLNEFLNVSDRLRSSRTFVIGS